MGYRVAVVGATGIVGREILSILSSRSFPISKVTALASWRSVGRKLSFGDQPLIVEDLENHNFSETDLCFMSAGSDVSTNWCPRIGELGCVTIDNSSAWRYHLDVPLVVPEVNPASILQYSSRNIISNPNCSTIQLVVALKPLHDLACIQRVVVSSYQSVSGAGRNDMIDLYDHTKGVCSTMKVATAPSSAKSLAFNVVPHIDVFMEDGYSREEWKMMVETKKMLDPNIEVVATAVRVPVFIGHSEAVTVEFERPISVSEAMIALREAPGCRVLEEKEDYITPREIAGTDFVYVSRLRRDISVEKGLAMWIVADNLRKGAALNAVQIAELLVTRNLVRPRA